ncbi:hypothetical protein GJ496_003502 [Pomphorhynchus laevis]|nr:hypothetical protein GJ496_003502 [Pomphorhynchus laevis]
MSERKVLNKYYPPDFDPSKLPRVKRSKNRQFTIRLMAPCNMRCKTCGEYIYKGKKFNARKEDVMGSTYLGIQIYRFYIKCTKCLAEITFKTDPANSDYELEHGAIRMFESVRLAEKKQKEEEDAQKESETGNPMKMLENRTRDSRREIATLEQLENLQNKNARNSEVDLSALTDFQEEYERVLKQLQEEEDDKELEDLIQKSRTKQTLKRERDKSDSMPDHTLNKVVIISTADLSIGNHSDVLNRSIIKPDRLAETDNFKAEKRTLCNMQGIARIKRKVQSVNSLIAYSDSSDSNTETNL